MQHIRLKAILAGLFVTLGLDILIGTALMFGQDQSVFSPDLPAEQAAALMNAAMRETTFLMGSVLFGGLSTVIGAIVCARKAPSLPYMHALCLGVAGMLLVALLGEDDLPLWFDVLGYVLVIPECLLGAWIAKRLPRRV